MPRSRIARLALAGLVAFLFASPDADAREREGRARTGASKSGHAERTVTRTLPDGSTRTSTHESTWQRGEGQWSRDTVHTGPQGGVTTRSATGSYDPETKTWSKDVSTTRPNGSTATSHTDRTRTQDGYQRTTTHTGPQGTTTVQGQGSWDPVTKTWTREKLVTRPDGSTVQTDVTRQVSPVAPEPAE